MGLFDRLRGKKEEAPFGGDPFGADPNMQGMPNTQSNEFANISDFGAPMGSPDQNQFQSSQPGPSYPGSPSQESQPQQMTPEAFGFEKIPNGRDSRSPYQNGPGSQQSLGEINMGKDLEIISAKLDAIKAELDSVNQRLKRVERLAEGGSGTQHKDSWSY